MLRILFAISIAACTTSDPPLPIGSNGAAEAWRADVARVAVDVTGIERPLAMARTAERWNAVVRGASESNITGVGGDFLVSSADNAFVTQPIGGLTVGETMTSAIVNIRGTGGTQQVQAHLLRSDGNGSSTLLHSILVSNPPQAMLYYQAAWPPGPDDVVGSGKSYYWYFNVPLAGTWIGQSGYTVDLP